jgi:Chloroplast import component protein (Tic20).
MALCEKCGAEVADDIKVCAACEAKTESAADKVAGFNNTADTTADFAADDIANNKLFAVLAYFGILFLVPLFAAPNSKFAKFHANQGLILCIFSVAWAIVISILSFMFILILPLLAFVFYLFYIVPGVLVILGIINAATGKAKELPIIGKFKILK